MPSTPNSLPRAVNCPYGVTTYGDDMTKEIEDDGGTRQASFRLSQGVLDDLDAIAATLTERSGKKHTRTDAIRVLSQGGPPSKGIQPAMLPHYGDIPCGEPAVVPDNPPAIMVDIAALFRGPERFLMTARGNSMTNNLIAEGDYLVIARKDTAAHGQTVVAIVDGAVTLKVFHIRKNGKKTEFWLYPASDHHEPVLIDPDSDARVVGVLVGVIRKY